MKLILQKDVKNLGKAGDQVSVKNGFARNFLIPKGYALLLNNNRLKTWKHQKIIIEAKKRKAVSERKALIDRLAEVKLVFEKESQKDNRIFGSVTAHEISQALEEKHKISVDKRDIHFSELKTVGDHKISIRLDSEQETEILLTIKGKIRKKKESASVKKTDQEKDVISSTVETASLSESKDQASVLAQEESAPIVPETKAVKKEKTPEGKADIPKTVSVSDQKNESPQKKISVKNSHSEIGKKAQSKDKSEKSKAVKIKTTQKQEEKDHLKDEQAPSKKQEESLRGNNRQAHSKKQEEPKLKKESKDKTQKVKSFSQDKVEPKKESKKSRGLLSKLFGKKK